MWRTLAQLLAPLFVQPVMQALRTLWQRWFAGPEGPPPQINRDFAPNPGDVRIVQLPIDQIDIRSNVRGEDAAPDEGLLTSVRDRGMLQPVRVRRNAETGRYDLDFGHRRFLAARQLGLATVPALIDNRNLPAAEIGIDQIAENEHRAPLPPMQLAKALLDLQQGEKPTLEQLAARTGLHITKISRHLKVYKTFPEAIRAAIDRGALDMRSAVEIAKVKSEADRHALAERAIREGWTLAKVAAAVAAQAQRRRRAVPTSRPLKRVLCSLPGGATVVITAPDGVSELTTEEVLFALEFAQKEVKNAHRKQIPAAELPARFQKLKDQAAAGKPRIMPAAAANGQAQAPAVVDAMSPSTT